MNEAIKTTIRRTTARFGFQVINRDTARDNILRFHLSPIFAMHRIDCVIDVGANKGQYIEFMRRDVGYAGPICAFEPLPENLALLRRKAEKDPLLRVFPFALGPANHDCEINHMEEDTFSSLLQPSTSETDEFSRRNVVKRVVRVDMRTLDSLCEAGDLAIEEKSVFLKLDTQGFDLEVLKGAVRALGWVKALQTEAAFVRIYERMPGFVDTYSSVTHLGFKLCGIFPVSFDKQHRCYLIEADCVFSR